MSSRVFHSACLFAVIALTACAPNNPAILQGGATGDGMVPVRDSGMKDAWVKADLDLSRYHQILLLPTEVQFRAVRPGAGTGPLRSRDHEFPVSPADRQRLVDTFNEVVREELATSRHLTLTNAPGPDVLLVRISLQDIVSHVPPEDSGRTEIYLDEIGTATVVLELQDATSGETLVRAVDRRAADPVDGLDGPGTVSRVTSVTAWSEVRRAARRFGASVTRRIDQLYTRGRMPG